MNWLLILISCRYLAASTNISCKDVSPDVAWFFNYHMVFLINNLNFNEISYSFWFLGALPFHFLNQIKPMNSQVRCRLCLKFFGFKPFICFCLLFEGNTLKCSGFILGSSFRDHSFGVWGPYAESWLNQVNHLQASTLPTLLSLWHQINYFFIFKILII